MHSRLPHYSSSSILRSLVIRHTQETTVPSLGTAADKKLEDMKFRLITQDGSLWRATEHDLESLGIKTAPFWGFVWPGGLAIARWLAENPDQIRGKVVIDVGSGCGIGCLVALRLGASRVVANDIDPLALESTLVNAELNNLDVSSLHLCAENLFQRHATGGGSIHFPGKTHASRTSSSAAVADSIRPDVVLLGDMLYDEEVSAPALSFARHHARLGATVLCGDPGRHGIEQLQVAGLPKTASRELLQSTEGCGGSYTAEATRIFTTPLPDSTRAENYGMTHAHVFRFL